MPDSSARGPSGRRFDVDVLLDAARDVFYADGFALAQMADIAREAGATKPTLYARLGNKEQIYATVLQREAVVFAERVAAAYARASDLPLRRLAEVGMEPLFGFARERPAGFHILFRGDVVGVEVAAARREVVDGVVTRLASLVRHRQRARGAESEVAADLIASACVGLALHVCERAIDRQDDLVAAQSFAASFVEAAVANIDTGWPGLEGSEKRTTG